MSPRQACLQCLQRDPPALFEAALWIAVEHDDSLQPPQVLSELHSLQLQVSAGLPALPARELAQPLLRRLAELDFQEDDEGVTRPRHALLHHVLHSRRGQPLTLALIALELARRLEIPLQGVNFPGHFLLRVPGADHLLDPCGGRRLYTRDCREQLYRQLGSGVELSAAHLQTADASDMLRRLSRNLRLLHLQHDEPEAALKDAERVLQLGQPNLVDHLARADVYQRLDCPQGERYDLERALLFCEEEGLRLQLSQRLRNLARVPAVH
ncbi:Regulator of sirC expression, contains transglutaminase-like and TPR domains [Ectopseudomonas composti]|uniref:Regulator of sirC expression, contains transglutaminase-like and TPR domains n=1 Tax=Ectopseudomonas composti TaxID=658457 RepID=A0A1I5LYX4_9GAMM|nr:transglutaminase family protein [Pseudomonas composti]SFP02373.1 Regulator of sirC expression, contains transglutaminase-like and TPR domains [Pseudomonas composti]